MPDLQVEHELSVEEGARWHGVAFESLALVCLVACIRVWVCVSVWMPASELCVFASESVICPSIKTQRSLAAMPELNGL